MKNRTSKYIFSGLIVLAIFGFAYKLFTNPLSILITVASIALIGFAIYFLVTRFMGSSEGRHQKRAFQKAAKRSKKRFQAKEANASSKRSKIRSLASARKKKDASHLTVIDGKKSRKKNRASF